MDDSELDRRLDALTRIAEPAAGNWTAIERRIRKRRWPTVLSAGAAAAAVLSGVALVVSQIAPTSSVDLAQAMQAEVHAMRVAAPETLAISDADATTGLMAAWQENQQAISQLEDALKREPGNRLLLDFLIEARMRQARLVRSIGHEQIPNNERSMNL